MLKRTSEGTGLTRREALRTGAGAFLGATAMLAAGGELARVAAQGPANNVQPDPLPSADPRFPKPPAWNRELRQLAPNVYAYTQGGGPNISAAGVSNLSMIAGSDFLWAIDGSQGPAPAKAFVAAAKQATGKEFGRLLLTHHHGDHTGGLQFFPHAEVWSHPYKGHRFFSSTMRTPPAFTTSLANGTFF